MNLSLNTDVTLQTRTYVAKYVFTVYIHNICTYMVSYFHIDLGKKRKEMRRESIKRKRDRETRSKFRPKV